MAAIAGGMVMRHGSMREWAPRGLAVFAAAGLIAAAAPFQGDSASVWTARSNAMAGVLSDGIVAGPSDEAQKYANKDRLVANLVQACDGLQGEQMRAEYDKAPLWAVTSQVEICSGMLRWGGKSFMTSKVPCRDMEKGLKDLAQASPGDAPPEVVSAASALSATVQLLLQAARTKDERLRLRCGY